MPDGRCHETRRDLECRCLCFGEWGDAWDWPLTSMRTRTGVIERPFHIWGRTMKGELILDSQSGAADKGFSRSSSRSSGPWYFCMSVLGCQ